MDATPKPPDPGRWPTLIVWIALAVFPILTTVGGAIVSIQVAEDRAREAIRVSEQNECQELALEISLRSQPRIPGDPPSSALAERLFRAYSNRYAQLDCPKHEEK